MKTKLAQSFTKCERSTFILSPSKNKIVCVYNLFSMNVY